MWVSTRTRDVSPWAPLSASGSSIPSPSRTPFSDVKQHIYSYYLEFEGGVALVELIYRSNMIALVGTGAKEEFPPNKVVFWDDSQLKIVGEINFKEKILGMKLREDK